MSSPVLKSKVIFTKSKSKSILKNRHSPYAYHGRKNGYNNSFDLHKGKDASINIYSDKENKTTDFIKNHSENSAAIKQSQFNDGKYTKISDVKFCGENSIDKFKQMKEIHLNTSIESQTDVESQESQPLTRKIRSKLQSSSISLYLLRKQKEQDLKIKALEFSSGSSGSPPGLELGPFFGLPSRVSDLFCQCRGISELYEWQKECIREGIQGDNLLISLPTSGGKTLVAEILLLRQILIFQRDVLVILPYVTLVQERVRGLSPFAIDLEFLVEEYAGSKGIFPLRKRRKNIVYIATIEKANILIDSLIEEERLDSLGLIVVDEVHMIGDSGGRGAKLEIGLIKLKYLARTAQTVSMSATVGNVEQLTAFLNARLYTGSFRPIPLTEYIKVGDHVAEINSKARSEEDLLSSMKQYSYHHTPEQKRKDPDCIMGLINDVIPEHSCLIFCPTRQNAEAVAAMLRSGLPHSHTAHRMEKRRALLRALKEEVGIDGICPILKLSVPYGIAYHHSGLTEGERKLIEEGYLYNTLCCICCTSTLAAGVNLPARRVIIRSPYVGREFLTRSRYQQMIGRAGRAGLDSKGESFLITNEKDLSKIGELLLSPVEKCLSRLAEVELEGLSELVFSMLGLKVVQNLPGVVSLVECSLMALQAEQLGLDVRLKVEELLERQYIKGFLCTKLSTAQTTEESSEDAKGQKSLSISRLGKAAIKGGISLSLAGRLYNDLISARSHLALHSHLHLLYLVTPYKAHESLLFKAQVFYDIYRKLSKEELEVARILGVTEAVAVKLTTGQKTKLDQSTIGRFYATLMLHQIMGGVSLAGGSGVFEVHRGSVQQFLFQASSFASSVNRFCNELDELWAFQELFGSFSRKLSTHCSAELIPLMELPGVKMGRARLLYKTGLRTLTDIANANVKTIVDAVDHLSYKVAYQIISSAKMLLLQKAEALQEEADDLLEGLGEDPNSSFLSSYKMTS